MTTKHVITERERRALDAVECVLTERWPAPGAPLSPVYPDAVPELTAHLDNLIDLASRTSDCAGQALPLLRAQICSECPLQFPMRYCPIRRAGRCSLYELAEPIVKAVRTALTVRGDSPRPMRELR